MKILHLGLMVNGRDEGLSKAFRKVATQYAEFHPNPQLPKQINELEFIPDLVFIQIQDDKIRDGRNIFETVQLLQPSINRLREKGAFVINWTGDKRNSTPEWMMQLKVDSVAFSNEDDVNELKRRGIRSDFLQIGIDPEVFKNYGVKVDAPEIVFMGNNQGRFPLSQFRMNVVNTLQRHYGSRFGVYGVGYPNGRGSLNADGNNPFPMQSMESKIYNNAKIGISISHFNSDRYTSDRTLRLMGSNCFCLSHHYTGIEKDFDIDRDLATFKDERELISKIDHYLTHENEREEIKQRGFELIHDLHTYDCMVQDIINLK